MIRTIGSLVQETSHREQWLLATNLYIVACLSTSMLLGAFLSTIGFFIHLIISGLFPYALLSILEYTLVGILAIAYALSDVGLIRLPRPSVMNAVPVTWWRWWRPYGAALAYGAALGLGVTTQVHFGAFYILCLWCTLKGNLLYGTLLMGAYGLARAFILFPTSWYGYGHCKNSDLYLARLTAHLQNAKLIVAVVLMLFGAYVIVSTFLMGLPIAFE